MRYADVAEGVRATIAAYTHALDDGRTDDIVATFCADGSSDMPGLTEAQGHDALHALYEQLTPSGAQRHLVSNTLVTDWSENEATAVSDVVLIVKRETGWAVMFVGRYTDTLHCENDTWRFRRRVLT
ncbi:MAG TPA: nuclear transport factor 2 family protein [Acidimicrobiia bacterium]|jgi:3-phenylpropionate/cinnamic acid dioxygenase small subunit|nr:nuclear transport factor 2 family protein [Acidimicrobiia bacterium]